MTNYISRPQNISNAQAGYKIDENGNVVYLRDKFRFPACPDCKESELCAYHKDMVDNIIIDNTNSNTNEKVIETIRQHITSTIRSVSNHARIELENVFADLASVKDDRYYTFNAGIEIGALKVYQEITIDAFFPENATALQIAGHFVSVMLEYNDAVS